MEKARSTSGTSNAIGSEARLRQMADALRKNMAAAEDKHAVLGFIFLKYISDAFETTHSELAGQKAECADPERLAERSKDTLGRVDEYLLSHFASAEGKKGGPFYTPTHVVLVLAEMLAPYRGRVYDPCCGSGGRFVQSEKFIEAHAGRLIDISVYGQESNHTTSRLAKMNLAIRGIDAQIARGDTFHNDRHPAAILKCDPATETFCVSRCDRQPENPRESNMATASRLLSTVRQDSVSVTCVL